MPDLAGRKIAYYGFTGPIESNNVTRISAAFNNAVNLGYDEVHLCFSSVGGYVADGIYLYNHIKGLPITTVIYNTGSVMSIAVAIFVAATERYCSAHSMFLIHPTSVNPQAGMTAQLLQSTLDAALADDARTESILRERTSIPADLLDSRRIRDVYISPQDAVSHGIVHGIREFSLPQGVEVIQI